MNYEQKYKGALNWIRSIYPTMQGTDKEDAEHYFPELCESEDERIIRTLKEIVNWGCAKNISVENNVELKDCLAWLEKQGEQKPTISDEALREGIIKFGITQYQIDNWLKKHINVVEHKPAWSEEGEAKFKVGDWVQIGGGHVMKILEVKKDVLCYRILNWHGDESVRKISDIDSITHLWTIQDAKDGDILEFGDHGRLVVGIASYVNKTTGKVDVYCLLENNNFKMGIYYNLDTIKPHPATKEQRNLLFQKMKEAGYEWDAEKKELRKMEQKPTWSEADIEMLDNCLGLIQEIDSTQEEQNWLKSLKDKVQLKPKQEWSEEDNKRLTRIHQFIWTNRKGDTDEIYQLEQDADWLMTLKPQSKQKWGEEDEEMLERCIDKMSMTAPNLWKKEIDWLNSLKDKAQLLPNQEWSKEDKEMIDAIIADILFTQKAHDHEVNQVIFEKEIDWLKSLNPQKHWKPSEEQMDALDKAKKNSPANYYDIRLGLQSLYNDLLKL